MQTASNTAGTAERPAADTRRWLTVIAPPLLAAAAVAIGHAAAGSGSGMAAAICRELLTGSDQGRQALAGSCWHAPLVTLGALPFVWLLGPAAALPVAAWTAWTIALAVCGRILQHAPWRSLSLMLLLAAGIVAGGHGAAPEAALPAALVLFALRSAALWWRRQGLRDLVKQGAALAGLALCGMPLAGVTFTLALLMPLGALRGADTRRRLPAILLLGWLPAIYALGVWMLMNRLIFGSALFFAASLRNPGVLAWVSPEWHWLPTHPAEIIAIAIAAYALVMGALTRNGRAGVLGALALLFWLWLALLRGASSAWAGAGAHASFIAAAILALWHLRHAGDNQCPPRIAVGDLLLFAATAWVGMRVPPPPAPSAPDGMMASVEAATLASSPYARVFVCGYSGLGLISPQQRQRIEPNLDLYVDALRQAYYGQNLFLLVPAPQGAAATENVHTRLPRLYDSGGGRMLFSRDYGSWRLFEIVGAPSERQLDEWRNITAQQ